MTKNYQRTGLDTSALAVPEQVSVVMEETPPRCGRGSWPSPWAPVCR